jgi:hypothetical protein
MSEKTQMQDMTNEELVRLVTDEAFWCGEAPDSLALSEEYAQHMTNGRAAQAEILRRLSATATPTEGEVCEGCIVKSECGPCSTHEPEAAHWFATALSQAGEIAELRYLATRTPQPTDAARAEAHAKLDALIDHRIVHPEPCFPPDGWHPENVSGCPTCEWSMRDEGLTDELDTASEVAAAAIAAAREEG